MIRKPYVILIILAAVCLAVGIAGTIIDPFSWRGNGYTEREGIEALIYRDLPGMADRTWQRTITVDSVKCIDDHEFGVNNTYTCIVEAREGDGYLTIPVHATCDDVNCIWATDE